MALDLPCSVVQSSSAPISRCGPSQGARSNRVASSANAVTCRQPDSSATANLNSPRSERILFLGHDTRVNLQRSPIRLSGHSGLVSQSEPGAGLHGCSRILQRVHPHRWLPRTCRLHRVKWAEVGALGPGWESARVPGPETRRHTLAPVRAPPLPRPVSILRPSPALDAVDRSPSSSRHQSSNCSIAESPAGWRRNSGGS